MQPSALQIPSGVVLDEPLGRALLFSAYHEGLLPGDDLVGDGFPRTHLRTRPSEALVASALEQLVIGGQVFLPQWLPNEWRDPLAELGIAGVPYSDDPVVDFEQVDAEIIFGMLAFRGR